MCGIVSDIIFAPIKITWAHLILCVLYIVLTFLNLHFGNTQIGVFPIELFLVFLPCGIGISLFAFLFTIAAARGVAEQYGYSSLRVAILSIKDNVAHADVIVSHLLLSGLCLFVILFAILYFAHRKKLFLVKSYFIIAFFVVACAAGYVAERYAFTTINLISSLSTWLYYETKIEAISNSAIATNDRTSLFDYAQSSVSDDTYIFIVESFGVFRDNAANEALKDIIKEIPDSKVSFFNVHSGSGGTVGGEFRELCGVRIKNSLVTNEFFNSKDCVPNQFLARHINSVAIHGGAYGMFNRPYFYRLMGFQKYVSARELTAVKSCGGGWISAPCDLSLIDSLEAYLPPSPRFVYFLSINTHFPYRPITSVSADSCPNYELFGNAECTHFKNLQKTLDSIAKFIKRNKGRFYIVGDHAPPSLVVSNYRNMVTGFEVQKYK